MSDNLTETQKFKKANRIAKDLTGDHPAYGEHHHETKKMRTVRETKPLTGAQVWAAVAALIWALVLVMAVQSAGLLR